MSPGTISSEATSVSVPSRHTFAVTLSSRRNASIDRIACASMKKPITALTMMTTKIAIASVLSLKITETITAPSSKYTIGLLNWTRKTLKRLFLLTSFSSFFPNAACRFRASNSVRPLSVDTDKFFTTVSADRAWGLLTDCISFTYRLNIIKE